MNKIERYRELLRKHPVTPDEIDEMAALSQSDEVLNKASTVGIPAGPIDNVTLNSYGKMSLIYAEFEQTAKVLNDCIHDKTFMDSIRIAADIIVDSFKNGGKLIACGNGGSMCDAMHFAAELTGRFIKSRQPFPAIAISDPAYLSCVANDFGYEVSFSRMIEAMAKPEDVIFLITTSGNSENIKLANSATLVKGPRVIALTGNGGGILQDRLGKKDVHICVPYSGPAARIQEIHIKVIHILCLLIEQALVK